jgi:hypothetical protein
MKYYITPMKFHLKTILAFPLCAMLCFGSYKSMATDTRDTVRIGIFFESIYDIDFANYSYNTNFWMWSVVKGDINGDGLINDDDSVASMDRIKSIELSNAKEYKYSHQTTSRVQVKGGTYWWAQQFCNASLYQKWRLDNYPFDKQNIRLKFESSLYDISQVIMLNEQDSLTFKKDINLIGWTISESKIRSRTVQYNTDFGDPNGQGTSAYSRVTFIIQLQRIDATGFFTKLCLGAFIAFLVSLLVFFIGPSNIDPRFGLGIGALFAVVANKYVVDSSIPDSATNCLVDKIHEITFVYILVSLICSAISLHLFELEKDLHRKRFDWAAAAVLFFSYLAIIVRYLIIANGGLDITK